MRSHQPAQAPHMPAKSSEKNQSLSRQVSTISTQASFSEVSSNSSFTSISDLKLDGQSSSEATVDFYTPQYPKIMSHESLQLVRAFLVAPCILMVFISLWKFPISAQFIYMTHWGNQLAIASTLISMYLGHRAKESSTKEHKVSERKGLISAAIVTLEFGLAIQIMVVTVYWSLIHEGVIKEVLENNEGAVMYWLMIYIHFVPFLTILCNVLLTRTIFLYEHYRYCALLGIVYVLTNFIGTKLRGKPLYAFLHWEDYTSLVISFGLLIVSITFYLSMSYLVNLTKRSRGVHHEYQKKNL